jgi:nucleoside 2-deoxyribosyltransferase
MLLEVKPPSFAERADRLLIEIARTYPEVGEYAQFEYDDPAMSAVSWSTSFQEMDLLLNAYLAKERGFLLSENKVGGWLGRVAPKGYAYLHELQHSRVASNIGFCAMWFDESVKPVWTEAIELAIRDAGYDPLRMDSHEHNNRIDDEIIAMIRRSKFVVADFAGQRGGVYFEAGFALGLGATVIWTCPESALDEVHFDNRQYAFVTWTADKLGDFKLRLQARIEATLGRGSYTPKG